MLGNEKKKKRSAYNRLLRENKTSVINSAKGIVAECSKSERVECMGVLIYVVKKVLDYSKVQTDGR